jgi:hypothetical protein
MRFTSLAVATSSIFSCHITKSHVKVGGVEGCAIFARVARAVLFTRFTPKLIGALACVLFCVEYGVNVQRTRLLRFSHRAK